MHLSESNFFVLASSRLNKGIFTFQASSSNSLSVEYGTGKWKTITGIQKFDVTEIGNQFSVILNVTDNDSLKIDLRYSKKPGNFYILSSGRLLEERGGTSHHN